MSKTDFQIASSGSAPARIGLIGVLVTVVGGCSTGGELVKGTWTSDEDTDSGDYGSAGDEDDGTSSDPPRPGGSDGGDDSDAPGELEEGLRLDSAVLVPASSAFVFGSGSEPMVTVEGAPADADLSRWSMMHDGEAPHLYFMRQAVDELYQLDFDPATATYVFVDGSSIPILELPEHTDRSSFAMLHDGVYDRLYFLSTDEPLRLIQSAFDDEQDAYVYGYHSIPEIEIVGTPAQADWSGWSMLHDGEAFRLYVFASGSHDSILQHTFNGVAYQYGLDAADPFALTMIPGDVDRDAFAMLHDGVSSRLFTLTAQAGGG